MHKRGEMGIGTLVIFLAMILVAAIAATTLIQTAMSLQNKALETGKAAQQAVATNAMVMSVDRTTNSLNSSILEYRIKLKLAPGSDGIKLAGSLLSIEGKNSSLDLKYTDKPCIYNETDGFYSDAVNRNGTYTVNYIISGTRQAGGYLQYGDIVDVCFAFPRATSTDRAQRIDFIPSSGIQTTIYGR